MKFIAPDKIFYHPDRLQAWINDKPIQPVTAEIHLSNRCNNNCSYCGQKHNHENKDMSIDTIKSLRQFMNYTGIKACYFSGGGESTLNRDFFTAVDELKGIEMGIITNGIIMPDELIKKYVQYFRWVRISLDASDPKTYKQIRGTNNFEEITNNIKRLLTFKEEYKSDLVIGLQIVVNEYNLEFISYIIADLKLFFPEIDYINIRPIETKINEDPYDEQQLDMILEEFDQVSFYKDVDKIIISEKWQNIFNNDKNFGFSSCHASEFILTIDVNGDVYPCCHVTHLKDYYIDNISNKDYFYRRHDLLNKLKNKGFSPRICPLGCRGSGINKSIEAMIGEKHRNFL